MIILIGSQKGGVGKSTVACNLASILVGEGRDVMLVDADYRQATASMWVSERKASHPDLPKVNSVQKYGEIDDALFDMGGRYQYLIVDAAGHDSEELRSAMLAADVLIMPFRPTQPDLDTLLYMSKLIRDSKRVNPDLKPYALINAAPTNSQSKDVPFGMDAINEYDQITPLNTVLHHRRIYWDAMAEGMGVSEMIDKSESGIRAKTEITNLAMEILNETL